MDDQIYKRSLLKTIPSEFTPTHNLNQAQCLVGYDVFMNIKHTYEQYS